MALSQCMDSSVFRFKRFSLRNERSGLKVGTDGVLLGAACSLPCSVEGKMARILDVGTGTGLIALMVAQRMSERNGALYDIYSIDVDADAVEEAGFNFESSPWGGQVHACHSSLQEFGKDGMHDIRAAKIELWDMIVSNPPFFENSLKAPDAQRSMARHTDTLSYRDVISYASRHLAPEGTLSMILPSSEEMLLIRYAASFGLYPSRVLMVRTTAAKAPKRMIVELSATKRTSGPSREELTMMSEGSYTDEFRQLTGEFYL